MTLFSYRRIAFIVAASLAMLLVFLPVRAAFELQLTDIEEIAGEPVAQIVQTKDAARPDRPVRSARPPRIAHTLAPPARIAVGSVATPRHPAQLSVRRLL